MFVGEQAIERGYQIVLRCTQPIYKYDDYHRGGEPERAAH